MTSGIVPMRASKIVENYRRSGYTLPDCKNEQDDNSLDAGASFIGLRLLYDPSDPHRHLQCWAHYDNGHGMTFDQTIAHLEIGAAPHGERLHGMAHTGGKTSGWNIGHDMIVASKVVGGEVNCVKMSTLPLESGQEHLQWEKVSYEEEISAETRGFFDKFPSGTIVCIKNILQRNKIDVVRLANQLEEGTKTVYNRVPENTEFRIQVQNEDPVVIHLRDPFYESETSKANLENEIDSVFAVYKKHGEPNVMLKSTGPLRKGGSGSGNHYTRGTPENPVYYNITRTLQAREGKSGKPIEWIEESDLDDYVFIGEIETRAIRIKVRNSDTVPSGYHIQRNNRHLGYDRYADVKPHPSQKRMRLRINFPPTLDEMFGVQFNKKNTTGIQNAYIKAAIDDYWRIITKPWVEAEKRRIQEEKQERPVSLPRPVPLQTIVQPNNGLASISESCGSSVTISDEEEFTDNEEEPQLSSEVVQTEDDESISPQQSRRSSVVEEAVPVNPCILWIRANESELKAPEIIEELCRLLNLRPNL